MKKITTLLLLAGVSGLLSAGDLQLNDKGYFELDGWRATPTTYSESWQALQPTTSREVFKKIDSESGVLFQMNFTGDVSGKLALALENEENATASVNMENGTLAKPFCLNTLLPADAYEGTKFEADGKIGHFPKEFDKTVIYAGTVKRHSFKKRGNPDRRQFLSADTGRPQMERLDIQYPSWIHPVHKRHSEIENQPAHPPG